MPSIMSLSRLLLSMPKTWKQVAMLIMDVFIILAAIFFSILLRLEAYDPPQGDALWLWIAAPVIAIPIFVRMGALSCGDPLSWK